MKRYGKRYVEVNGFLVEFYMWGDEITPAIRVSVVEQRKIWFMKRYVTLYSESHRRDEIESYRDVAKEVVENYKKELKKWK